MLNLLEQFQQTNKQLRSEINCLKEGRADLLERSRDIAVAHERLASEVESLRDQLAWSRGRRGR